MEKNGADVVEFDQDPYLRYYGSRQFGELYEPQEMMQKRRFAMGKSFLDPQSQLISPPLGMPNLVHVGMMQKRQLEQINMNKRRIGK